MKRSLIIATVLFGVVERVSPQVEQLPSRQRGQGLVVERVALIIVQPLAVDLQEAGEGDQRPLRLEEDRRRAGRLRAVGRWRNHLPKRYEAAWGRKLPMSTLPRTYSGITTGSERVLLRGGTAQAEGVPRPDLNLVFDQVTYHAPTRSLVFFTGGLTAAYDVLERRWTDLEPRRSPPPVLGGSLAHDPVNDEIVLAGGGNVAEAGPNGRIVGYTSTWVYRFRDHDWQRLLPQRDDHRARCLQQHSHRLPRHHPLRQQRPPAVSTTSLPLRRVTKGLNQKRQRAKPRLARTKSPMTCIRPPCIS